MTAQDYYRRIYFEAIDLMMNAIDQRFDQPSFDTYEKMESLLIKTLNSQAGGGGGGTPYIGLYGEAPPERGTFFRLQVYKRVGVSQVEVYKRVGKSVVSQREVNK